MLAKRTAEAAKAAEEAEKNEAELEAAMRDYKAGRRYTGTRVGRSTSTPSRSRRKSQSITEAMTQMVVKELKGTTGRRIVRGILGGLFKGR